MSEDNKKDLFDIITFYREKKNTFSNEELKECASYVKDNYIIQLNHDESQLEKSLDYFNDIIEGDGLKLSGFYELVTLNPNKDKRYVEAVEEFLNFDDGDSDSIVLYNNGTLTIKDVYHVSDEEYFSRKSKQMYSDIYDNIEKYIFNNKNKEKLLKNDNSLIKTEEREGLVLINSKDTLSYEYYEKDYFKHNQIKIELSGVQEGKEHIILDLLNKMDK